MRHARAICSVGSTSSKHSVQNSWTSACTWRTRVARPGFWKAGRDVGVGRSVEARELGEVPADDGDEEASSVWALRFVVSSACARRHSGSPFFASLFVLVLARSRRQGAAATGAPATGATAASSLLGRGLRDSSFLA